VNRVPAEYLGQFTAIHLDGWPADAAQWAADIIRKQNGMVFLDTGSPKPGVHELIRLANHVNCPEHFITAFIETRDPVEGAQRILEMGPGSVSVTLGDKGAILVNREEVMKVKAHNIEVVDTNGAGDAFCGAMIFGIMKGIPGKQTLALANAAAALKCEKLGNTDSLPSLNKAVALANLATSVDRL
jgi:ribokinase